MTVRRKTRPPRSASKLSPARIDVPLGRSLVKPFGRTASVAGGTSVVEQQAREHVLGLGITLFSSGLAMFIITFMRVSGTFSGSTSCRVNSQ